MGKALTFDIRVKGNGTREQIISSLNKLVADLSELKDINLNDAEFEDEVLSTEIWSIIPEPKANYKPTEEDIEDGFFNREAGYES